MSIPTLRTVERKLPPNWAVRQRDLIGVMNRAAVPFVDHSTRSDGTLIQRTEWTSMDGTDNGYEAFLSFPLHFLLGGCEQVLEMGQKEWDAITWQYENYGTVEREFVTGFDWFHHSESYTYLYYLAMADPGHYVNRERAVRFAAMYTGEDPLAPNWDPERKMIRSPLNGSKGPRFVTTQADWDYHRPILAAYLAPFEDIPGADSSDPLFKVDWTDDEMFQKVLTLINERMTRGDEPLNLMATSMVTHAYIYTGDDKYKQWVLDYLQAWLERRDRNDGIMPDNIGPNGEIGELMNGKWWGGYYGWRWPHGSRIIIEPALVAGSCALLMTGDASWLDLCRSQLDLMWSLRREEDGVLKIPARHGDQGWFDYRAPDPYMYIHLYYLSQSDEDRARISEVFPGLRGFELRPGTRAFKGGAWRPQSWLAFLEGHCSDYPEETIDAVYQNILRNIEQMESDDTDPETRECYHFQAFNPVLPEALVQLAMGTPAAIYNGGLLQSHLRYFDAESRRPGLPEYVAALADKVTADSISLSLVNTDAVDSRTVLIQSGCFAEHEFTEATMEGEDGDKQLIEIRGTQFQVHLGPSAQTRLHIGLKRYCHRPTYEFPRFE